MNINEAKILICDDSTLARRQVKDVVGMIGTPTFFEAEDGEVAVNIVREEKPDMIILDPPRDGIHPKALPKIINYGVDRIVYISCKPTSLVRDLEVFLENGYEVEKAVAVDQFPWTANVETVALLKKNDKKKKVIYREEAVADCGCIYG